jgi:preprotein translocase subunit SecA
MDWDNLQDKLLSLGEGLGLRLKDWFGSRNERLVRGLAPLIQRTNELESWAKGLTAEQFHAQTALWKAHIAEGKIELETILPDAFALCREASRRTLGLRHYDVQLVGGIVLHRGAISEMMTGEGKTLVATLPLYLNALSGKSCFLVTVNDYLARRDASWMGPIYDYLGVSCGFIQSDMSAQERVPVYACDLVYGTNNEFGFDYLRDNMKNRVADQVQRDLYFAIVDEVDSILVDEARTPLIITGPAEDAPDKYRVADQVARQLEVGAHFEVKEKERAVSLLEAGIERAEKLVGVESFYTAGNEDWPHYIENALRAHHLYKRDTEYVVEEGEVIIVDEFTGRKMTGRRWSDGLHQAVETKEGLEIRQENQTLATITFQNYFRMYKKLAGMTGTAMTEAGEFLKIYKLDVVSVPTHRPVVRDDADDVVYRTEAEKWRAITKEVRRAHEAGQPLLIGTTSIEKSEHLSKILGDAGIRHEVLNAKNHEREASIVAKAGEKGAVTVSTNMAGRGTDIKLGGNFEFRLREALEKAGLFEGQPDKLAEIDAIRADVRAKCDKDEAEVKSFGGLYVLGTERHEARRIDNQLRGRSGRQGDPGTSRFYLSLEDDLMRRFYKDWVKNAMLKLGMTEDTPIESRMVSNAIRRAQKKVEDYHFEIRKHLLEYDEVMDHQRKTIYGVRQDVLEGKGTKERVDEMIGSSLARNAAIFVGDAAGFGGWFQRTFGVEAAADACATATAKDPNLQPALEAVAAAYGKREAELGADLMRQVERYVLLTAMDSRWKDHLHAIDALKQGIGLRGYAQRDPKNEYKKEAFELFQKLFAAVEDQVASVILRLEVGAPPAQRPPPRPPPTQPPQRPAPTRA